MNNLQSVFGFVIVAVLLALLWRQSKVALARQAGQGQALLGPVFALFEEPELQHGHTEGVWILTGRYRGHWFQLKTVTDTLALRKLPSLWLLVTLPEPQKVCATLDLMMRAAGVSSFSNFDFLPINIALPAGFPADASLRGDSPPSDKVIASLALQLRLFCRAKGKELLISPQGLRIVLQLAEGDRARYGVFREANFSGAAADPILVQQVMDTLLELRNDLNQP